MALRQIKEANHIEAMMVEGNMNEQQQW